MQKTFCLTLKGTAWLQASDLEARLLRTFRLLAPMGSHIKTVSTSKTNGFGIGKIRLTACSLCFIVSMVHGLENCMEQEGNVKPPFLRTGNPLSEERGGNSPPAEHSNVSPAQDPGPPRW